MVSTTRIVILSNSGGAAKTTMATHLGYALGASGKKVALLDFDPQGSLSLFTGLKRPQASEPTLANVLREEFDGNWNLHEVWAEQTQGRVEVCRSNTDLVKSSNELVLHERGAYVLADRLADYPLPHDFLIFDCPATLGPLPLVALSAATHVLIVCQLEPKSLAALAALLTWIFEVIRRLRLNPAPTILGVVPSQYDRRLAIHRRLNAELIPVTQQIGIKCFNPIRHSADFKNASAKGLPLHLFRPNHPAIQDLSQVVEFVKGVG